MWVEPWDGAIVLEDFKIVFVWYYHANSIVGRITCSVILHVLFHTIHHHYITYLLIAVVSIEYFSYLRLIALAMPKITLHLMLYKVQ